MTYDVLKNKMENGTPFLKADAQKWIDALPLSVTPEQVEELKGIAEARGLDFLPSDGAARLSAVEDAQEEIILAMADMMGGAL